jgi:hypothetical protein
LEPRDISNRNARATKMPGITMSPRPNIENGRATSPVGKISWPKQGVAVNKTFTIVMD